jgi:hypothetical protein
MCLFLLGNYLINPLTGGYGERMIMIGFGAQLIIMHHNI